MFEDQFGSVGAQPTVYKLAPERILVKMDRDYRDKMVRLLLDILVGNEPVPVKVLEPGLPGVAKYVSEFTKLGAKEVMPVIRYMKEKGWIAFEAIKNDFYLVVTLRGKKHWKKQQIPLELPKTPLEGALAGQAKWLVVMFDIPNKHKTARDKFRKQLLSWGFAKIQESTFVTPYDWRAHVENLRMLFGVAPYVTLIEAVTIERDPILRKIYGLK